VEAEAALAEAETLVERTVCAYTGQRIATSRWRYSIVDREQRRTRKYRFPIIDDAIAICERVRARAELTIAKALDVNERT
jgi:hypothetical protein